MPAADRSLAQAESKAKAEALAIESELKVARATERREAILRERRESARLGRLKPKGTFTKLLVRSVSTTAFLAGLIMLCKDLLLRRLRGSALR
jgi:hypothetical protein